MKGSPVEKVYIWMARKYVCLTAFFSTVVLAIIIMKIDAGLAGFGGRGIMYLQTAFTRNEFMEVLSAWRSGGVDIFLSTLWINYIYAASYAVLFASSQAYFTMARIKAGPEPVRVSDLVFFILPFVAAIFDWIAVALLQLLFSGRNLSEDLILAMSVTATVKWALIVACLILLLRSYFSFRKVMKKRAPESP